MIQNLGIQVPEKPEEINILILGETGVGKSTWINAIANYLEFQCLEDAKADNASKIISLIPSSFAFIERNVEHQISIGKTDQNENTQAVGKSATQGPKQHQFKYGPIIINFIDTPGIGDTRGIEKDKENFTDILSFIR